jgi:hypothetical protein
MRLCKRIASISQNAIGTKGKQTAVSECQVPHRQDCGFCRFDTYGRCKDNYGLCFLPAPSTGECAPGTIPCTVDWDHSQGNERFILESKLQQNPTDAESMLKLAEKYSELEWHTEAKKTYHVAQKMFRQRARMGRDNGSSTEETYYAHYQVARITELLGAPDEDVLVEYLKAFTSRPSRMEPLYRLAVYFRKKGKHDIAFSFASTGVNMTLPNEDTLGVDWEAYSWRMLDELGVVAFFAGMAATSHLTPPNFCG